ncbi:MAG: phosphatase PAP2 family protein [Gammaproteobacteria bacterium]
MTKKHEGSFIFRKFFLRILGFICCFFSLSALALTGTSPVSVENSEYWAGYFSDFGHILIAPAQFTPTDWVNTAYIVSVGGVLFALDGQIRDLFQTWRSLTTDAVSQVVQPLGHWQVMLPVVAGSYLLGGVASNPHLQETALLSLESVALSGAMIQILKYSLHRYRPVTDTTPNQFDGPSFSSNNKKLSMPCGDAGVAFSIASVIGHEYPTNPVVQFSAYGLATLVGLERINFNKHYASDVFVGSVLGYLTGSYLVHQHSRFNLEPIVTRQQLGIKAEYQLI